MEKFFWDGHFHVARQLEKQLEQFLISAQIPRSSLYDTSMPSTFHTTVPLAIPLLKIETRDEFLK